MAAGTHPACSTDAVDVIVGARRQIDVENMCDALDVQSSSGNIGSDEHFDFAAAEAVECILSRKFT